MTISGTPECECMDRVARRAGQTLMSAVAARRRLDRIIGDLRSRSGSKEAPEGGWRWQS